MAYTTSGTFPENLKTTSEAQNSMFVNFFAIFENEWSARGFDDLAKH